MNKNSIIFASLVFLIVSCSNKTEDNVALSHEKMVDVIVDLQLLGGAKVSLTGKEIINIKELQNDIFIKHKIQEDEFNDALNHYASHPEKLELIYKDVISSLSLQHNTN